MEIFNSKKKNFPKFGHRTQKNRNFKVLYTNCFFKEREKREKGREKENYKAENR